MVNTMYKPVNLTKSTQHNSAIQDELNQTKTYPNQSTGSSQTR